MTECLTAAPRRRSEARARRGPPHDPKSTHPRLKSPPTKTMKTAELEATPELFPDLPMTTAPPPSEMLASGAPMSEISPGVWVSGMPEFLTPSHVLCRLVPSGPGTYTLAPEPYPGYVRMTEDIGKRLGIVGLSETTLRRLMWGGFVEHFLGAPGCTYISIESLLEHIRRTRNDHAKESGFWTAKRRLDWKATCAGRAGGGE